MHAENYSGSLTREQFLFFEIRIVADLILKGLSREEIFEKVYSENLFQFPTEKMIRSITRTCFKRIYALDSENLLYHLVNDYSDTAKQINLYAIMCNNSIVYDFMTEVIGEKYRLQEYDFSIKDVNVFFMELEEKVPAVRDWSESTIKKIKQVLVKFLVECGYLENRRSYSLQPVSVSPELEDVIREKNDVNTLAAFNCFV